MNDANKIFDVYVESSQEPKMTEEHGIKTWTLNGKLHRDDGPAIEYPKGGKQWYQHGKLHRIGAPAIDYPDGEKHWMLHGRRHNVNGAAVEYANGYKEWHVNDVQYDDVGEWARAALKYENKPITQEAIDAKIQQVMQQDLFS